VDLTLRPPGWWQAVKAVQLLLAVAAVAGFAWLAVVGVLAFLQVHVDTPFLGFAPLPTVLLAGGLLGGALTSLIVQQAVNAGAKRRRMAVAAAMRESVQDVAWSHVVAPIAEVLTDHRTVREALNRAL
jgi:hypothetical protein